MEVRKIKAIKKLVLSLLVCTTITAPTISFTVFAEDTNSVSEDEFEPIIDYESECKGDCGYGISHIPLETQLEDFLNDPNRSEESKQATEEKIQRAISFRDNATNANHINNYTDIVYPVTTLGVPSYTQINGHYCGPATTEQSLQYLGYAVPGYYAPSQKDIAKSIGTTTSGTEWYRK